MFNKTFKKSLIILVACLMLALVVFAACNNEDTFKPVATDGISGQTAEGNGGIAVKYGDYIYYVNGHQSSNTTDNSYTNTVRSGSIVRVKASKIDDIVALNDEDLSSTEKTERIETAVKENVQIVIPCYYYSTNTTTTSIAGIYIFNDRLYITTPNQALTDGGQTMNNQLVLESYKLDGSDRQQHHVIAGESWSTSTAGTEIMLSEVSGQVYATYVLESNLHSVKVSDGTDAVIAEEISNAKIDGANNVVFYQNEDGEICQYNVGATEGKVLVAKVDTDESKLTYTITAVSDGYVYYTQADSVNSTLDGKTVYYAHFDGTNVVNGAVLNASLSSYLGWGAKAIYVDDETHGSTTAKTYTVYATYVENGETKKDKLFDSRDSITLVKVEKGLLYYTADGVTYTLELGTTNPVVFYAKDLSSSTTTGWAQADVIGKYTFALSTDVVKVTVYNAETKKNSTSTNITLVEEVEEEDAE